MSIDSLTPARTAAMPQQTIRPGTGTARRAQSKPSRRGVGVGLILTVTTGTQLRAAGPFGLGEMMLLAWLGLSMYQMSRTPAVKGAPLPIVRFWTIVTPVLMVGPLWSGAIRKGSTTAPRDALALALMALLCFVAAVHLSTDERERIVLAYSVATTCVFVALYVVPQLARIFGANPYYSTRFVGWALNPNQVAIDIVWVPFMLLRAANRRAGWQRIALRLITLGALFIGWVCDSDSLRLGWGFALFVLGIRSVFAAERSVLARQLATAVMAVMLGLGALKAPSVLKVGGSYIDSLRFQQNTSDGGGRGRLQRHAIMAWTYSPIIGLGPGLFSGLGHPFTNEEAHNSTLDFLMKAGAVGVVSLVILCRKTWKKAVADGWASIAAFSALIMFTTGHNVLRHPAPWILITLISSFPDKIPTHRTSDASAWVGR